MKDRLSPILIRALSLAALLSVPTFGLARDPAAAAAPASAAKSPPAMAEDYEMVSWRDRYLELGRDVYEWACAACHAEGVDGAPRIGDQAAWSDRSELWSAVLLEHAKQGYLEMPAKGGHPYLSERAVQAAAEYMLGETFPEKLRD